VAIHAQLVRDKHADKISLYSMQIHAENYGVECFATRLTRVRTELQPNSALQQLYQDKRKPLGTNLGERISFLF
jgi:hypothetical protein